MAATKSQLITAVSAKIVKGLNKAELKKYDEYFCYKETTLTYRNTRKIKITMMIPQKNNENDRKFFKYLFFDHIGINDYYETLDQLSEQILDIGYQNNDISVLTPAELSQQGFIPEDGTNIYEIKNMLTPDNYKLVMTGKLSYGQEYETDHEEKINHKEETDHNSTCRDIFEQENLTIFGKTIAHRNVKVGTEKVKPQYIN